MRLQPTGASAAKGADCVYADQTANASGCGATARLTIHLHAQHCAVDGHAPRGAVAPLPEVQHAQHVALEAGAVHDVPQLLAIPDFLHTGEVQRSGPESLYIKCHGPCTVCFKMPGTSLGRPVAHQEPNPRDGTGRRAQADHHSRQLTRTCVTNCHRRMACTWKVSRRCTSPQACVCTRLSSSPQSGAASTVSGAAPSCMATHAPERRGMARWVVRRLRASARQMASWRRGRRVPPGRPAAQREGRQHSVQSGRECLVSTTAQDASGCTCVAAWVTAL